MSFLKVPPEAQSIILAHQKTAPVRVTPLLRELGIKAYIGKLPENVSGKLYKDPESASGWSMKVKDGEASVRQRFTLAHELGHFFLHKDEIKDGVEDDTFYRSKLSNRQEAEANAFAADLLMPWTLIESLTKAGTNTAEDLAAALNVSQVAMNIRLGLPT